MNEPGREALAGWLPAGSTFGPSLADARALLATTGANSPTARDSAAKPAPWLAPPASNRGSTTNSHSRQSDPPTHSFVDGTGTPIPLWQDPGPWSCRSCGHCSLRRPRTGWPTLSNRRRLAAGHARRKTNWQRIQRVPRNTRTDDPHDRPPLAAMPRSRAVQTYSCVFRPSDLINARSGVLRTTASSMSHSIRFASYRSIFSASLSSCFSSAGESRPARRFSMSLV